MQVLSVLLLTLMIWGGNSYAANAAAKPYESGYPTPVDKYSSKLKLAGKYFWVDEYGGSIYYSGSKNAKGKKLVPAVEGLGSRIVTNGQNLIYTVANARTGYTDVYQVKIKNAKKKKLGKYKTKGQFSDRALLGYYDGKVIISDSGTMGATQYPNLVVYNLKNGKSRRISGTYSSPRQYGRYFLITSAVSHAYPVALYVYNLATGRKVKISNCCSRCEIVNGGLYFAEEMGNSMVIKKCSLSGKKMKTLAGKITLNDTMGYIHSCAMGKTYAIYSKGGSDGWYKVTYKTKKISKSTQKAFEKLKSQGIGIYGS